MQAVDVGDELIPRVFLIDDNRICRDALTLLLGSIEQLQVVGSDRCRAEALDKAEAASASLLLVEIGSSDSLALAGAAANPGLNLHVLAYGVPDVPDSILACAEAGVSGYLLQAASLDDLLATAKAVARDDFAYPPRIVADLVRRISARSPRPAFSAGSPLSSRELRIVECLIDGLSNKEIAARLQIAVHTVKNHIHNIFTKLGVHTRAQAANLFRGLAADHQQSVGALHPGHPTARSSTGKGS